VGGGVTGGDEAIQVEMKLSELLCPDLFFLFSLLIYHYCPYIPVGGELMKKCGTQYVEERYM
jgi:hypothetical protein